MILALYEHPNGVTTEDDRSVVYDLGSGVASLGAAQAHGAAVEWRLAGGEGAALAVEVELEPGDWVVRCDRVDFPPGSVAYRHVHPGPGIRRLLGGTLTIETGHEALIYGPGEAWFEGADQPVLATASASEETTFVRVLLLPAEWAGKRTIRYLDPADDEKPKRQRAEVLLEEPLRL